jgi:PAS domain S-box-containing protein
MPRSDSQRFSQPSDAGPSTDFEALFQILPQPSLLLNASRTIIAVNLAYLRDTGFTRDALLGKNFAEWLVAETADEQDAAQELQLALERTFKANAPDAVPAKKYRLKNPGGGTDPVRTWETRILPVGPSTEPAAKVLVQMLASKDERPAPATEMHERNHELTLLNRALPTQRPARAPAEAQLRESEQRYRMLTESLPQLVWTAMPSGECDYLSRQWTDYTGVSELEHLGYRWTSQLHPEDVAPTLAAWKKSLTQGSPFDVEYRLRRSDGEYRWFKARALPFRNGPGQITRWFGTCTDVHETKQASGALEERVKERTDELKRSQQQLLQAQKLEAIGRLAGGVAHDFNNLLTGILGISEDIFQTLEAEDPRREDLSEVIKASYRARELTKQLLAFGRRQVNAPTLLDINQVITDMSRLFERLLGEDIQIHLGLAPGIGTIRMDQTQLEQVIINLMLNARDAITGCGHISLETGNIGLGEDYARRHPEVQPGSYVHLSISDDGGGMDDQTLAHIFEPFFTTKERGKGTGLGLATVYGIVKQHNGEIAVTSHRGRGTTFNIYLPRVRETAGNKSEPGVIATFPRGTETILLVDDEDLVRRVAVKPLRGCGYQVLEASNAAEALQIAAAYPNPIDLLVTDVVLPITSGPELAETLRRSQPRMAVLFMSGHAEHTVKSEGTMLKEANFVQKSFTAETLCQKVRAVLDQRPPPPTTPLAASGESLGQTAQ